MEKLSPKRPKILALDLDGTLLHYDGFKGRDEFGELPSATSQAKVH